MGHSGASFPDWRVLSEWWMRRDGRNAQAIDFLTAGPSCIGESSARNHSRSPDSPCASARDSCRNPGVFHVESGRWSLRARTPKCSAITPIRGRPAGRLRASGGAGFSGRQSRIPCARGAELQCIGFGDCKRRAGISAGVVTLESGPPVYVSRCKSRRGPKAHIHRIVLLPVLIDDRCI